MANVKKPEKVINNMNDLRGCVSLLTASSNTMCNSKTAEELAAAFTEAKELLAAIYKYNVNRLKSSTKKN